MTRFSARRPGLRTWTGSGHGRSRKRSGPALLAAGIVGLTGLLPALALISRDAWLDVLEPGPAELAPLVTGLAGPAALGLAGWLLVAVLVSVTDALATHRHVHGEPGWAANPWFDDQPLDRRASGALPIGRPREPASSRWARRVAPAVLRHGVAALIGVTLLSSPAVAAPRAGSSAPGGSSAPAVTRSAGCSPAGLSPTGMSPTGRSPAGRSPADLSPAWPPVRAELSAAEDDRYTVVPGYVPSAAATPEDAGRQPIYAAAGSPAGAPAGTTADAAGSGIRGWLPDPPALAGTSRTRSQLSGPGADLSTLSSTGRRRRLDDDDQVVVRRGDTLWGIAARSLGPDATTAQIAGEWPRWFSVNRTVIGSDPNRLRPGQRLTPPAPHPSAPHPSARHPSAPRSSGGEAR